MRRSKVFSLNTSLRAKVIFGVLIPLVMILGAFSIIEYSRFRKTILENLSILASHNGQVIEDNLRHQMQISDFEGMQTLLDTFNDSDEFRVVYVLDPSGEVIFAPEGDGVGLMLDNQRSECQPCHKLPPLERPESIIVTVDDNQQVFRSMQPIENSEQCNQCHEPEERILGLLLIDLFIDPLEKPLAANLRENIIWWVISILVTVFIVTLVVNRFVLNRLEGFSTAIVDMGEGQLPLPLPESQPDEIGRLSSAFNAMVKQVKARNAEINTFSETQRLQSEQRGELLRRLITAQEDERKRVARDLHDELGQTLSGLSLRAEALKQHITPDSEQAIRLLDQISMLLNETLDQMYDLILALRPSVLDDMGLPAALDAHVNWVLSESNITFELDVDKLIGRMPPEVETTLYRVFQEALNNIVRHAKANHVQITLRCNDGVFEGEILDDGQGFDIENVRLHGEEPRGLGLLGMKERVLQFNGQLDILSQPGKGTRIFISIPVPETHHG
jgi:signal transduction histidine kinase